MFIGILGPLVTGLAMIIKYFYGEKKPCHGTKHHDLLLRKLPIKPIIFQFRTLGSEIGERRHNHFMSERGTGTG